jgi:hypothetical protein
MPQCTNPDGVSVSLPHSVHIFAVSGDPNSATVEQPVIPSYGPAKNQSLVSASIGSLAIDYVSGLLWQKTAAADASNPTGVWSAR